MASTYVNDLRLEEMATGDQSGTWGETTNTNLELISEAFSFGTEAITTNADTHTTSIADGATDPGRSMYLKYTGTLDSACTITIGPNTVSKMWFIENGTSGSQNIIISQGSGANITIPPGDVKVVYSDGAGSGAAVVDAFASLSVVDLKVQDDLTVTGDIAGTLSTAAQPNITSLGTLTAFNVNSSNSSTITCSTAVNLRLKSVDDSASAAPILDFIRDSASPAANDNIGKIRFRAEDSASVETLYASITTAIIDPTDGSEDASLAIATMVDGTSVQRIGMFENEVVINQQSIDSDFRVESNGKANMLFVDGGNNRVGVNTDSPDTVMEIVDADPVLTIRDTETGVASANATLRLAESGGSDTLGAYFDIAMTGQNLTFGHSTDGSADSEQMRLEGTTGDLALGTTAASGRLHVNKNGTAQIIALFSSDLGTNDRNMQILSPASDSASAPFEFSTSNSFQFTIDGGAALNVASDKNVGIGTVSPSRELELSAANPRFRITDTDGGYSEISGNSGHLSFSADEGNTQGGTRITFDVDGGEIARFNNSGKLGIGTTTIESRLTVSATLASGGILLKDESASSASPLIQVIGQRSDGNTGQSFSGGLSLAQNQTNAKGADGKKLGTVYFGINHTDGTEANIAYSASISAELSGAANSATDMPTDLCFYTGSTGRDLGTANVTFGDEAMRIAASGNVGISTNNPLGTLHVDGDIIADANANNGFGFERSGVAYSMLELSATAADELSLFNKLNNDLVFGTNGTERARIDNSGNVGIGTDSPNRPLEIKASSAAMRLQQTGGAYAEITSSDFGVLYLNADAGNSASSTSMRFLVDNSEAVRILADGTMCINATSSGSLETKLYVEQDQATSNKGPAIFSNPNTGTVHRVMTVNTGGNSKLIVFDKGFSNKGSISTNGTSIAYNTTSDYRLKENINYTFDATTRLKQLKPARFNFIEDETNTLVDGFIAHEVSSVVPEAVTGEKDAVDGGGNAAYQEMDASKLVPLLVKTIQELEERITALES